ncbi:unnamed protein product [Boreogadus saida]
MYLKYSSAVAALCAPAGTANDKASSTPHTARERSDRTWHPAALQLPYQPTARPASCPPPTALLREQIAEHFGQLLLGSEHEGPGHRCGLKGFH